MITIQNDVFKKALEKLSSISGSNVLHILENIKLEYSKERSVLTKTIFESFIELDIDVECKKSGVILLDEKKISSFVKFSKGESTTINVKDKKVLLTDGISEGWFALQNVAEYPIVQKNEGLEKLEINKSLMNCLKQASKHTMSIKDSAAREWQTFVHTKTDGGINFVVGVGDNMIYSKQFVSEKFPTMSIDPKIVSVIDGYTSVNFSQSDNYYFFESVGIVYGFRKYDTICKFQKALLDKFVSDDFFVINKDDLILYFEWVVSQHHTSLGAVVELTDVDKSDIHFKYEPISEDGGAERTITTSQKTYNIGKMYFSAKEFLHLLKSIDYSEEVKISKIKGWNIINIPGKEDYVGAISETYYQ